MKVIYIVGCIIFVGIFVGLSYVTDSRLMIHLFGIVNGTFILTMVSLEYVDKKK